jgi:phosphopantothenoylcysteine decarboxylase/phosphopantothenate--cysteine ligase
VSQAGQRQASQAGLAALAGRTVALAVTGSIAAYKAVEVARLCLKAGAKVLPLMTTSAARFVGPVTLSGITGEPVATDMWDPDFHGEKHVVIAQRADVLAIVPATADVLARLAQGRADDLVTATALCARGPVLVAPAMHPRMWDHPATKDNVAALLRQGRVAFVGPTFGPVASGESGVGRMADPDVIASAIARVLTPPDLAGRHIVVTAGPTFERIDPVRFLGNRSSGKMGFAIAARAASRGAKVTLLCGPVSRAPPPGVARVDIETAAELAAALDHVLGPSLGGADALVMAAAVADFRPDAPSDVKIKKEAGAPPPALTLTRNPDVLAAVARRRAEGARRPVLVGFALETGEDADVLAYARRKLAQKRVDIVVANAAHVSLGHDTNRIAFVEEDAASLAVPSVPFVSGSKDELADLLLDRLAARLST